MDSAGGPSVSWTQATQSRSFIKYCDMREDVQQEATEIISSAIEKYVKNERLDMEAAAKMIKDQMDKSMGPSWHCVIGQGFTFEISCQKSNVMYMYYAGKTAVLLWKC